MRRLAVVLCLVAVFVVPGTARASVCVPQGASGVNEYLPTVPGADCTVTPSGSSAPNGGGRVILPPPVRRRLAAAGPVGQAILGFTEASAPGRSGSGGRRSGTSRSGNGVTPGPRFRPLPRVTLPSGFSSSPHGLSDGPISFDWLAVLLLALILLLPLLGFLVPVQRRRVS